MISRTWSITRHSLAIIVALLVALAAGGSQPAQAANIIVSTTDDELNSDGDCSLREAITAANTDAAVDDCSAGSGADIITLLADTYTLSIPGTAEDAAATGDLDITDDLTITGAGAGSTIVDGGGIDRVFEVPPDATAATVEIADLTVSNGSPAEFDPGGGISNRGSLTLNNAAVTNNSAYNGAGIANYQSLTLNNSTVSENPTTGNSGGGIVNFAGTLTLTSSTVAGNSATGDDRVGGGIAIANGTVTVENSTIAGNTATGNGGGIFNAGKLTLTNVTISGNTAGGNGGGIANPATATLTNVTISGNTAGGDGGGIYSGISENTVTLTNVIIANSSSGGDCSGPITSNGNNLDSDGTCGLSGPGDLPNTPPNLGPLANNGGPTQTHALLANSPSPAIDAGNNTGCPATDQRGVARPVDGDGNGTATCDIGAYEYEPPVTLAPTPTPTPTPAELPPGGGDPASGGDAPRVTILLLMAGALGLAGVGSALAASRHRR